MGLLIKLNNGDTSFKSLKFGQDRPGGGDSGQPYVQTSIKGQAENTAIDGDGIIRGGLTAPSRALEDANRLSRYLFDFKNPNGLLFTAKQNLLSRIAAKPETATGPAYGGFTKSRTVLGFGSEVNDAFTEGNGAFNEGIYTPLSTIMQAQVGYLGQHVNKMGLDPTGNFPDASIKKYSDVVFEKNKAERNTNIVFIFIVLFCVCLPQTPNTSTTQKRMFFVWYKRHARQPFVITLAACTLTTGT